MKLIKKESRKHYSGQLYPQNKRLTITRDGDVILDYNPEVGSAVSIDRWNNVLLTLTFSGHILDREIKAFYAENKALFEVVHRGHSVVLKNTDYVGILGQASEKAWEMLQYKSNQVSL
jgi:hypothetical protein